MTDAWASVYRDHRADTVAWLRNRHPHVDAEDIVQEAFIRCLGTEPRGTHVGWLRGVCKRLVASETMQMDRSRQRLRLAAPVLVVGPADGLVPLARCKRRQNKTVSLENKRGHELGTVPCPVCEAQFKPYASRGKQRRTCSIRCGALLRHRTA